MNSAEAVAEHYTRGDLEERILKALRAIGKDPEHIAPEDLRGVDEFHIGGAEAAEDLALGAGIGSGTRVLDLGCGIGGPARLFAHRFGALVHGVDVTGEFVQVAQSLTGRSGLADRVAFTQASALDLPFGAGQFDAATLLHVGMNIQDKATLMAETARVLKPGGVFAIFDIMQLGPGQPEFPLPWATDPAASFVASPLTYSDLLEAAGFEVESERNRLPFALDFMQRLQRQSAADGPAPLGMHLVLGPEGPVRMANLQAAFAHGILAPIEILSRRG